MEEPGPVNVVKVVLLPSGRNLKIDLPESALA
jgi:hypothetical protein